YLLLGFFFAGLMHAFIPRSIYKRFLSGQNLRSVINAALLGIPLPLCSCGVLPTAMSLRKEGASHSAVVSFLIATPQTGVDSIIATYSLMGLPFAIIRPIAALVTAVFGGALVNSKPTSLPHPASEESSHNCCHEQEEDGCCCHADTNPSMSFFEKMKVAIRYAFVDMDGIVRPGEAKEKASDAEPLGRTESAPLREIARETNLQSVNLYAEAIYRATGKTLCGSADYDSCRVAQGKALEAMGLDPESVSIVDGSGLSRRNYISPEFMTAFLKGMAAGEDGKVFIGTLSTPGEGTAWALLKDCPRKANFRLKSGSMSGVLCYSGYLLADNGQPLAAISIMINGAQAGRSSLQSAAMDPLLQEIADFFLYL
ncbi:MAG: D-alanyl-D-alanine carboxypeptidase, partial [Bacteroidales bacterium]|nr:D-alanyl-D-alanine carboxypeptidase [Bacteroidales bacterium]